MDNGHVYRGDMYRHHQQHHHHAPPPPPLTQGPRFPSDDEADDEDDPLLLLEKGVGAGKGPTSVPSRPKRKERLDSWNTETGGNRDSGVGEAMDVDMREDAEDAALALEQELVSPVVSRRTQLVGSPSIDSRHAPRRPDERPNETKTNGERGFDAAEEIEREVFDSRNRGGNGTAADREQGSNVAIDAAAEIEKQLSSPIMHRNGHSSPPASTYSNGRRDFQWADRQGEPPPSGSHRPWTPPPLTRSPLPPPHSTHQRQDYYNSRSPGNGRLPPITSDDRDRDRMVLPPLVPADPHAHYPRYHHSHGERERYRYDSSPGPHHQSQHHRSYDNHHHHRTHHSHSRYEHETNGRDGDWRHVKREDPEEHVSFSERERDRRESSVRARERSPPYGRGHHDEPQYRYYSEREGERWLPRPRSPSPAPREDEYDGYRHDRERVRERDYVYQKKHNGDGANGSFSGNLPPPPDLGRHHHHPQQHQYHHSSNRDERHHQSHRSHPDPRQVSSLLNDPVPQAPPPSVPTPVSGGSSSTTPIPGQTSATSKPRRKPGTGTKRKADAMLTDDGDQLLAALVEDSSRPSSSSKRHHGDKEGSAEKLVVSAEGKSPAPLPPRLLPPVPPRPTSPQFMKVYPIDVVPPLEPADDPAKIGEQVLAERLTAMEALQIRIWLQIAREEIPKAQKLQVHGYIAKLSQHRRVAGTAAGTKGALRPYKKNDSNLRAKKITKEVGNYWRRSDKEELEMKKRLEKEAFQKSKQAEETREAERQARKLEFLITQTELYSHFVGNKGKGGADDAEKEDLVEADEAQGDFPADVRELDFDQADSNTLRKLATRKAQRAAARTRKHKSKFEVPGATTPVNGALGASVLETEAERTEAVEKEVADLVASRMNEANQNANQGIVDLDSDELNFQNPSSMKDQMTISQPQMLNATLKDYQLKGLNWLATLYDQGINGILADEMGLGKTVQSISLLAHLAEAHNIWGPFLVVAPASTLHNWHQELTRFVPALKAIPYWGQPKDRQTLRKFWANDRHAIWTKDSECHVVVTSYTMMINDYKYFQALNWQFLILDEAQAIKNSNSARWKALLGLNTRNRLLLTGTPIQNSMQELWALLHFIMPSLFDSHDEFSEWFSKDSENQSEGKGNGLTEHQLRRLHLILKPFMLRRVKRMVQSELAEKVEIDVFCELSPKQRALYRGLRSNISISDLLSKAAHLNDAVSARHLMNLVMQFRKVCNHPELFQRTDVIAPFAFCNFAQTGSIMREGNFVDCPDSASNPIEVVLPRIMYQDGGLLSVPGENARVGSDTHLLYNLMNIWSTDNIEKSTRERGSAFSFLPLVHITAGEAHSLYVAPLMKRLLLAASQERELKEHGPLLFDSDFGFSATAAPIIVPTYRLSRFMDFPENLPPLDCISETSWRSSYLSRPGIRCYIPAAVAPPMSTYCSDRTFVESQERLNSSSIDSIALYGLPPDYMDDIPSFQAAREVLPGLMSPQGLIQSSPSDSLHPSVMQIPNADRLIFDSAKLARLDALLQELKAGGHRVLIYFQMTKMIDLMEEYLVYRQYKYLRLDGESRIEDRRDMVLDWQTRPDLFVFLLSTHAGGLGINLTAADTVIFYENDWNPSNDSQAMDRAHRIGQTKQVTVYRLITRGTIDERIVQLARVKKDVSDIVVGNKDFREMAKPTEIVSLLLDDEELRNIDRQALDGDGKRATNLANVGPWDADGDDFFSGTARAPNEDEEEAAGTDQPSPVKQRRGKGRGGRAGPRGSRAKAVDDDS
ncbi:putative DNA helicase ino80 [Tulasnella sp. 418]|nr:putative DNA helicase ino80 [Tulasnella sp. 418]